MGAEDNGPNVGELAQRIEELAHRAEELERENRMLREALDSGTSHRELGGSSNHNQHKQTRARSHLPRRCAGRCSARGMSGPRLRAFPVRGAHHGNRDNGCGVRREPRDRALVLARGV